MDILNAKKEVIRAGILLVKEGLIQRTWGNVSCRVNDTQFAITPSGRDYLSLRPDDIVIVNIADLSYEGEIKPSSEKGIHAKCYELRPEINFVIHTHQTFASLLGLTGCDVNGLTGEAAELIGDHIPLAAYGLPGTKKLRSAVTNAILRSDSKAVLMLHHGALCMGGSLEETFRIANELEHVCKEKILSHYHMIAGKTALCFDSVSAYVAAKLQKSACDVHFDAYDSIRSFGAAELTPCGGGEQIMIDISSGLPLDPDVKRNDSAALHAGIYRKRPDVNAIVHSKEPATFSLSKAGITVKPFLDDFAQIVGLTLRTATVTPDKATRNVKQAVNKLRGRDAVLISHNGALCVGSNAEEAQAVKLVTEKGCKACITAKLYQKDKASINCAESLLMRVIYKAKYAKKK